MPDLWPLVPLFLVWRLALMVLRWQSGFARSTTGDARKRAKPCE